MRIIISSENTKVSVEISSKEVIQMNNAGIDLGSLFEMDGESSFNEDDYKDDDVEFFCDGESLKDINPPEKEEVKFLCHTNCDGGYCAEKTGFVKAWLDQHQVPYEKKEGIYTKYITYTLTASQLKELNDMLVKNGHLDRGVFI